MAQRGLPPQATYTFKHALIQDAAYQSLLKSTRQQYHQRIAQVLEALSRTAETQPELLAHHYIEAGLHAQAIPYWRRAGQRALGRSAYQEAVACFEQALVALSHLQKSCDARAGHRPPARSAHGAHAVWRLRRLLDVYVRPRPSPKPSMTLAGWDRSPAFCQSTSTERHVGSVIAPPSAPSRLPQPMGISPCRRWRTSTSATPTRPMVTIIGRSTAWGRP